MGIFRFLLAFAVVVTHTGGVFMGIKILPGYVCVELFFIISGYYMEFILSGSYAQKKNFYLSRFLRLWPLYITVIAGYFVLQFGYEWLTDKSFMVSHARQYSELNLPVRIAAFFSNLFMIGQDVFSWFYINPDGTIKFFYANFLEGVDSNGYTWGGDLRINGPAWSIGLEIWFYLLVPFLHKFKTRSLLFLLIASFCLRLYLSSIIGLHTYFFFPTQLYLFLAGMLAFRLRNELHLAKTYQWLLYAILFVLVMVYRYMPGKEDFLRLIILPAVLFFTINSMFQNFLSVKWDRFIGDLSYPIYIVHSFIQLSVPKFFEYLEISIQGEVMDYLIYAIIIFLSSIWVWRVESVINKYRWLFFKKEGMVVKQRA